MTFEKFDTIDGFRTMAENLITKAIDANPELGFPDVVARAASHLTHHMRAAGAREELATAAGDYVVSVGAVIAAELLPDLLTP